MEKRIIYTNDEGGISIIVPAGEIGDCIKDVPSGKAYEIVDASRVPSDRSFRNAWKHQDGAISVDMPKAVEIQKERLRAERAPLLAALYVEMIKSLETGDSQKQEDVIAEKKRLRDITNLPALSEATTPEALKAVSCSTKEK